MNCWTSAALVWSLSLMSASAAAQANAAANTSLAQAEETLGPELSQETADAAGWTVKVLPGGARLRLAPGTEVEMERPMRLMLGPPGAPTTPTQTLSLRRGRIEIEVPETRVPTTAVLVRGARGASAVAHGGRSSAVALEDSVSFVATAGDMLASAGKNWNVLPEGTSRTFDFPSRGIEDRPVAPAPRVDLPESMLAAAPSSSWSTEVVLSAPEDAPRYEVDLMAVRADGDELLRRVTSHDNRVRFGASEPGRYRIVARAFDAHGVESLSSKPLELRVISYRLPEGGYERDGAVYIDAKQRLALVGAEDLELSYDGATHFVQAPRSVGLTRGQPTLVRLREPGSRREAKIQLLPRNLQADVGLGPPRASFPRDAIDVRVRLMDLDGKPAAESGRVRLRASVNLEPARVTWRRSGSTIMGTIPPAHGKGPWVVRVEAFDDLDQSIGRSFLEVAATPKPKRTPRD